MASIKKMNLAIAELLYGEGKICLIDHWKNKSNRLVGRINFHENYDALMEAMQKAMGDGSKFKEFDESGTILRYTIYPSAKIENKKEKSSNWIFTIKTYTCAFSLNGISRIEYGEKFNDDFRKPSPILAMHYSLYRLIKNGLEY